MALLLRPPSEPLTVTGLVLGLVLIPLLFPTGRLPSRRWRPVVWAAGVFLAAYLLNSALSPRMTHHLNLPGSGQVELYDVANPLSPAGLPDVVAAVPPGASTLLLPLFVVMAGAAVVVRFRRSAGIERQQMKWFVYAAGLVAFVATAQLVESVTGSGMDMISAALLVAGLSAYPVSVGVAVLRYRQYEVDRLISRTVSYGLVVALLGAVYVGVDRPRPPAHERHAVLAAERDPVERPHLLGDGARPRPPRRRARRGPDRYQRMPREPFLAPPREVAERHFEIVPHTEAPRGGHFAAMEQPELWAADVARFFRSVADR